MTTKLKNSFKLFILEFSDPSRVDKNILNEINFPIEFLFKKQKHLSDARKVLGKQKYRELFALYFNQFHEMELHDLKDLREEVLENKDLFLRGIGKERLELLTDILNTAKPQPEGRRGLLFEHAG